MQVTEEYIYLQITMIKLSRLIKTRKKPYKNTVTELKKQTGRNYFRSSLKDWQTEDIIPFKEEGNIKPLLTEANFAGSTLKNADLKELDLLYANFNKTNLTDATLTRANLFHASFLNADLKNADFSEACLRRANLCGADLTNADFSHADLRGANFAGAKIDGACFFNSNLQGIKNFPIQ